MEGEGDIMGTSGKASLKRVLAWIKRHLPKFDSAKKQGASPWNLDRTLNCAFQFSFSFLGSRVVVCGINMIPLEAYRPLP